MHSDEAPGLLKLTRPPLVLKKMTPPPSPPRRRELVTTAQPKQPRLIVSKAMIGVGAAGLVVGAIFAAKAHGAQSDQDAATTPAAWVDAKSRYDGAAPIANVGLIAGGVLAAAGLSLLLFTDRW